MRNRTVITSTALYGRGVAWSRVAEVECDAAEILMSNCHDVPRL